MYSAPLLDAANAPYFGDERLNLKQKSDEEYILDQCILYSLISLAHVTRAGNKSLMWKDRLQVHELPDVSSHTSVP